MLNKAKIKKIIFLKNFINKKKNNKNKIISSIILNSEVIQKKKQFFYFFQKVHIKKKKNCIFGISSKYIHSKSKISRFALQKINNSNLNQNFLKNN